MLYESRLGESTETETTWWSPWSREGEAAEKARVLF
jgi:hypothetical protein